jgi:hypothetical protein
MVRTVSRLLYAASATIFAFGGLAHALVYAKKSGAEITASNLSPFFQAELKALWLCDSTTLVALAAAFFYLAVKPTAANRTVVLLMALVPAGTTFVLYAFLGAFYAAHLLLLATSMAVVASLLTSETARSLSAAAGSRA